MERFHCPELDSGLLEGGEAHHCLQVLRKLPGDSITVFDGQGREWKARIDSITGRKVRFSRMTELRIAPAPKRITLVQAITKGKAMDLILQKATELGVSEIIPIASERTVARVTEERVENKVDKWRETIIEAAKQSGQNWLPTIRPARRMRDFLSEQRAGGKLIGSLQAEARPLRQVLQELISQSSQLSEYLMMIGPEGDFTPAEIGEARSSGYLPVSLGPLVLRSETAALYTLSVLKYELQL